MVHSLTASFEEVEERSLLHTVEEEIVTGSRMRMGEVVSMVSDSNSRAGVS